MPKAATSPASMCRTWGESLPPALYPPPLQATLVMPWMPRLTRQLLHLLTHLHQILHGPHPMQQFHKIFSPTPAWSIHPINVTSQGGYTYPYEGHVFIYPGGMSIHVKLHAGTKEAWSTMRKTYEDYPWTWVLQLLCSISVVFVWQPH